MSPSSDRPRLPPRQQLVGPDRWPLVGETSPAKRETPWTLSVLDPSGNRLACWTLDELLAQQCVSRKLDLHCVTRWSKYDVAFTGIPLLRLLNQVSFSSDVKFLSFIARSDRHHSTSLSWADVQELDPLVALGLEHEPLPTEHGGPIRLIVPDRYFYKSLKWLETIALLHEDRLGFWEAEAGYHNHADPWQEERFMAASLTKRDAAALLASRDFRDRDLRGLHAAGRDLTELLGQRCRLRDADLDRALLIRADFNGANLSGARLRGADLRFAKFCDADLEGCDFSGADLRGADFSRASLFGATFASDQDAPSLATRIGPLFPFSEHQLEMLTEREQRFLLSLPLQAIPE